MPGTIKSLWPQVCDAFATMDCILHAGDLHVASVIDELETLAPTYVCYGNGDVGVNHPRLQDAWLGSLAGVQVGLVHKFPTPRHADEERLRRRAEQLFTASQPRVVVYGHTHLAEVHDLTGRLYINPGSPTLPNNQSTRHGTVGVLTITRHELKVEILQIDDNGLQPTETHVCQR